MRELTMDELDQVSGGTATEAVALWGTAALIGQVTYGTTWGTVGAIAAFTGATPLVALTMVGLAFWGGYQYLQD